MSSSEKTGKGQSIPEWEAIEPTYLFNATGDCAPRPEFRNPVIETAVRAVVQLTDAPDPIAMHSVLSTISIATQGLADVSTLNGSSPLSLFFLTIAASGERKSACDKFAIRSLREFEAQQYNKYLRENAEYQANLRERDAGVEVIEGESSARTRTDPPSDPTIIFSDLTPEGLFRHFEEGNPSVAIVSAEGGQFFGGYSMRKGNRLNTAASYSQVWDDGNQNLLRASNGSRTFRGKRLTIHLQIQPGIARDALADLALVDQGFYSRVLIAFPKSKIGTRTIDDFDLRKQQNEHALEDLRAFDERIIGLLKTPMPRDKGNKLTLTPNVLPLSREAEQCLVRFYNWTEVEQLEQGRFAHIHGFASKCPEMACRLAGMMTVFEDEAAEEVGEHCMENAVSVIEWHLSELLRLRENGYVSPELTDADRIRVWLMEHRNGGAVSVRSIMREGPRPARDANAINRIMEILEQHVWVHPLPKGTVVDGVKPRKAWQVRSS